MEFPFDVNDVLPFEVTIFNEDYRVLNPERSTRIFTADKLTSIIDAIGDASYRAQGLHGAVTTARKFRMSDHHLYIIKKGDDNNNLGSVVGILKVGSKHLYIYDSNGQVYERSPLCVLDFYVHESKQRLGYGRKLFDTMLNFEKCAPYALAIDRPSNKCLAFLHKHYNLSPPVHQVNNFVVYQAFFNQPPVLGNQKTSPVKQRPELTTWLLPSERQSYKHLSEQKDIEKNQRIKASTDQNHLFPNQQPTTMTGHTSVKDTRRPASYYTTSYGRHYNSNTVVQEQPDKIQYTPRTYSQGFNRNNSSRNSTNEQIIPKNNQSSIINNHPRTINLPSNISKSESNNHQQLNTNSSSSAWRIFGIPQLFN